MCSNFILRTGILLLIASHFVSSLPFGSKKASESDFKLGDSEGPSLLTRLRRTIHEIDNEETSLESRFGGYRNDHDHFRPHEDFGKPHYSHRKNEYFNQGPPRGHPGRDGHYGHVHHHGHHSFEHPPRNHHGYDLDFHSQSCDHHPNFQGGNIPYDRRPSVTPDIKNPTKNKPSRVDVTEVYSNFDLTTEKSTPFPKIDIRVGTRK